MKVKHYGHCAYPFEVEHGQVACMLHKEIEGDIMRAEVPVHQGQDR
jgi:hypothetical protein